MGGHRSSSVKLSTGVRHVSVLGSLLLSIVAPQTGSLRSCLNISYRCVDDTVTRCYQVAVHKGSSEAVLSCWCVDQMAHHERPTWFLKAIRIEAIVTHVTFRNSNNPTQILPGVFCVRQLSFDKPITDVVHACHYHTRALRHVRPVTAMIRRTLLRASPSARHWIIATQISIRVLSPTVIRSFVYTASYRSPATNLQQPLTWLSNIQRVTYKRRDWTIIRLKFYYTVNRCTSLTLLVITYPRDPYVLKADIFSLFRCLKRKPHSRLLPEYMKWLADSYSVDCNSDQLQYAVLDAFIQHRVRVHLALATCPAHPTHRLEGRLTLGAVKQGAL